MLLRRLDLDVRSEFAERSHGEIEGVETAVIRDLLERAERNRRDGRPVDGETGEAAVVRARPALEERCRDHHDAHIVVVAHSGSNNGLIATIVDNSANLRHRLEQGLTCVNELEYEPDGKRRVRTVDETAHLR